MATINTKTQTLDRSEIESFVPRGNFRTVKAFENLFDDVATTIPSAIEQTVQGPAGGAVDDNVVVFDGTSGVLVKDSGVSIDDLAPLDSPAFTGIPTAPTAAPGTSTTQIATTAFVAGETDDAVDGPASATNNAIALFDGVSGKLIKDSAVLISEVALLASPAFTGTPTAPTAALGTDTTQIATTAFVQDAIDDLATGAAYFSAHNNGVNQSIPDVTFTKLNFSTELFDVGAAFATSTWTPPSGRPVSIVASVSIATTAGAEIIVSIFKNGAEFKRGVQQLAGAAGNVTCQATCIDVPNGTDTYDAYCRQNTGVAQNTSGLSRVTYFMGTTIRP